MRWECVITETTEIAQLQFCFLHISAGLVRFDCHTAKIVYVLCSVLTWRKAYHIFAEAAVKTYMSFIRFLHKTYDVFQTGLTDQNRTQDIFTSGTKRYRLRGHVRN